MLYSKLGKWFILREDEYYRLPTRWSLSLECKHRFIQIENGMLIIKAGYAWDGSSVPFKQLTKFIWNSDKGSMNASLVHDALCQLMRIGFISTGFKLLADELYRDLCLTGDADGNKLSRWNANLRFKGLRMAPNAGLKKEKYPRNKIYKV